MGTTKYENYGSYIKNRTFEEELVKFIEREKEDAKKALSEEKNICCINPDSYMAKEIKYQTVLLHEILETLRQQRALQHSVFAEERELLRKQLELLAKKSTNSCSGETLAILSEQMVNIYSVLKFI